MSRRKEQWAPKVTSLRKVIVEGEEQWIEFDPATYVIPAGHPYYDIIAGMHRNGQRKGA